MVVSVGAGYPTLSRGIGLADLEPGDGLGGRARHFGEELVAVVDAEGRVGVFDGEGSTGVTDADVDFLAGDDEDAAAADASFDASWFRCGGGRGPAARASRMRACSIEVSGLGRLRSRGPVGIEEMQHSAVEADGDAPAARWYPMGCCRPARLTRPMALTSRSTPMGAPGLSWPAVIGGGPAGAAVVGEELTQVGEAISATGSDGAAALVCATHSLHRDGRTSADQTILRCRGERMKRRTAAR
ncbi:hypothetical protein [Micromonospora zamorensis]|uniref:hypothetical protein n=1 Tax=Micromonospora zamorensis TaxID=709883 RepID=UPI0033BD42BB